jgi:hypothetical protein
MYSPIHDHPSEPILPCGIDGNERVSRNFRHDLPYGEDEAMPALELSSLEFCFQIAKEEEVTRRNVWAICRLWHSSGMKAFETLKGFPRIVRTCIVQAHEPTFQGPSPAVCPKVLNQIKQNRLTKEYAVIYSAFRYIK